MSLVPALRPERLVVPLPAPIMSGLGPLTTTGVLLVFLDSDEGVIGENLVFTRNNKRLAGRGEMVAGRVGRRGGEPGAGRGRVGPTVHRAVLVGCVARDQLLWPYRHTGDGHL